MNQEMIAALRELVREKGISEWAVMSAADGVVLNWLGAGRFSTKLADGAPLVITSSDDAWRSGKTALRVQIDATASFSLWVRIPAWTAEPSVTLNGESLSEARAGQYLKLKRSWRPTDRLALNFQTPLRFVAGANETAGKVSLYRGPLLLASDQSRNVFDEGGIPVVDLKGLTNSRVLSLPTANTERERLLQPWLLVSVPTADGRPLTLVDFASAGADGTSSRGRSAGAVPPPPRPAARARRPAPR